MAKIDEIDRPTDAAILLFHLAGEVDGITKIQKLLYLIEEETSFGQKYEDEISFNFRPYKMGPFSPEVYEEVEFLLNIDAIEKLEGESTASENWEISRYDEEEGSEGLSGKRFRITEKGRKIGEELANKLSIEEIDELKDKLNEYNDLTLTQLLEYVYTEYPKMTVESEIKNQVMS